MPPTTPRKRKRAASRRDVVRRARLRRRSIATQNEKSTYTITAAPTAAWLKSGDASSTKRASASNVALDVSSEARRSLSPTNARKNWMARRATITTAARWSRSVKPPAGESLRAKAHTYQKLTAKAKL